MVIGIATRSRGEGEETGIGAGPERSREWEVCVSGAAQIRAWVRARARDGAEPVAGRRRTHSARVRVATWRRETERARRHAGLALGTEVALGCTRLLSDPSSPRRAASSASTDSSSWRANKSRE